MKKASIPKPNKARTITVTEREGESQIKRRADLGLSPVIGAAITASIFAKSVGEIDPTEAVGVVMERVAKVKNGDMSDVEATLTAQAMTLNSIFNELARRAALNMGEHLGPPMSA